MEFTAYLRRVQGTKAYGSDSYIVKVTEWAAGMHQMRLQRWADREWATRVFSKWRIAQEEGRADMPLEMAEMRADREKEREDMRKEREEIEKTMKAKMAEMNKDIAAKRVQIEKDMEAKMEVWKAETLQQMLQVITASASASQEQV